MVAVVVDDGGVRVVVADVVADTVVVVVAAALVVAAAGVVVAFGQETEAWWDRYVRERACAVLSNACFQFESHSFVQWQLRQTLPSHTIQTLRGDKKEETTS